MRLTTSACSLALAVSSLATDPRLLARSDLGPPEPRIIYNKLHIINATPYRFRRINSRAYQVTDWSDKTFPEWVNAGEMITVQYGYSKEGNGEDSAADVAYRLNIDAKDSHKRFTIHLQGHRENGYNLEANILGGLEAAGHGTDQKPFRFVFCQDVGGRSDTFVLAGDEKHGYTTVAPPANWMNAMAPAFKQLAIRDIVMPASHDSGASSVTGNLGGIPANTQTQDVGYYGQLERGIRYFDTRPYLDCRGGCQSQWQLGHFTGGFGGFGQSVLSMITDINRFNKEYPGELIILDMTDGGPFRHIGNSDPISPTQLKEFLDQVSYSLAGINHRYTRKTMDPDFGLAAEPLSTFFSDGQRSPVLIVLPNDFSDTRIARKKNDTFTGFIAAEMLPVLLPSYSNTPDFRKMRDDQHDKFISWGRNSRSRDNKWGLWLCAFTLSVTPLEIIQDVSWAARDVLYDHIWNWAREANGPPNFLSIDYVKDRQVAALAMALNMKYALPKVPGW